MIDIEYPHTDAFAKGEVPAAWFEAYATGNNWSVSIMEMPIYYQHIACCGAASYRRNERPPRYIVQEMWGLVARNDSVLPHARVPGNKFVYGRMEQTDDLEQALDTFKSWVEAKHNKEDYNE